MTKRPDSAEDVIDDDVFPSALIDHPMTSLATFAAIVAGPSTYYNFFTRERARFR